MTVYRVGDKVIRVMEGFKKGDLWKNEGIVAKVSDTVITCTVYVDVPRTMQFDARTGINLLGKDYGWLETTSHRKAKRQKKQGVPDGN